MVGRALEEGRAQRRRGAREGSRDGDDGPSRQRANEGLRRSLHRVKRAGRWLRDDRSDRSRRGDRDCKELAGRRRRGAPDRRALSADITSDAVAAVFHEEAGRLTAALTKRLGDFDLAEECVQDALVSALEHWPREGVPDNPAAWLMTAAKRRALDHLRRLKMQHEKHEEIGADLEAQEALVVPDFVDALDAARQDEIGDDLLRLIFTACHPVLSTEARVALTLKLLGGLTTHEIARAYLVPEP